MSDKQFATWNKGDKFSIYMKGTCAYLRERILTLVEDFNDPFPSESEDIYNEEE